MTAPEDSIIRNIASGIPGLDTILGVCIDRLPESYRAVLLLRDIEEFDTEETARLLDCTPNNVKVRLHRARQALKALLDPSLAVPG